MTDIQTLKSTLRIESVAARYATLHKAGSNYTMLCPFHDDHHPSLVIHTGKQFFKCHACGMGGDVFTLVQQLEKCSFTEAVEKLGGKPLQPAAVTHPLPPLERGGAAPAASLRENEAFLKCLLPYASGHLELSPVYLDFEVGMAPYTVPKAWKAFAGRIIFPIRDEKGCLVGFGGRIPDDAAGGESRPEEVKVPKYVNSSAAAGFQKGNVLYGLCRAEKAVREKGRVFVVEGYRDVLAMHAAGYRETVGLCGTALAEGQVQLLKGLDADVVFVFDGDEAGRKAVQRNALLLEAAGIESSAVQLQDGDDPDSVFRRLGREGFCLWLEDALHPADVTEEWLVTVLLMFPEAVLLVKGECYDFPMLLESLLVTDNVPFVNRIHQRLLQLFVDEWERRQDNEAYQSGNVLQDIEDIELRTAAATLYSRHCPLISRLAAQAGLSDIDNEKDIVPFTDFLFLFIREYYETRLYSQIRELSGNLCRHPGGDAQPALLAQLDERREILCSVSRKLDRVGAVVN